MSVVKPVVDHADDHARARVGVPGTGHIGVLAGDAVGLAGVLEVPLVVEVGVVGDGPRILLLQHEWRERLNLSCLQRFL